MTDDTEYNFGATAKYIEDNSTAVLFLNPEEEANPFKIQVPSVPQVYRLAVLVESDNPEENRDGIVSILDDLLLKPESDAEDIPFPIALRFADRIAEEMLDDDLEAAQDEVATEGN